MNILCNNRSCFISSSTQVHEVWRVTDLCARWPCWTVAGWSRCTLSLWARRTSSPCSCSLGGRTADRAGLWWWRTDSHYSESCCLPLPLCPSALWHTQEVKTQANDTWSGDSAHAKVMVALGFLENVQECYVCSSRHVLRRFKMMMLEMDQYHTCSVRFIFSTRVS